MKTVYHRLTFHRWAWIHTLVALGVWAVVIAIFTPDGVFVVLQQPIVGIWTAVTVLGVVAAIVGVFMSVSHHAKVRVISVSVELFGIVLAAVGPFTYLIAQLSIALQGDFENRIALVIFAYYAISILLVKFAVVLPRYRKEASDYRKSV